MAIEIVGSGGGGEGDGDEVEEIESQPSPEGKIEWRGGRCIDCRFWIRENRGQELGSKIGNCVRFPPEPQIVLVPQQQMRMLQTQVQQQQVIVPQNFTVERATNHNQGCGEFQSRQAKSAAS